MSFLKGLAKKLKTLLKEYDAIKDIIIFGSVTTGKMMPADIDIALIAESPSPAMVGEIKISIDKEIRDAHLQFISYKDFLGSTLPYRILSEGYSVKENAYLPEKLKVSRKALYSFTLENLSQVQKVMFNKGLKTLLKNTGSEKVGRGAMLSSVGESGQVEDFLRQWDRKIAKKEFLEI